MTFRDFIRIVRFIKWPVLWVVGCLLGLIWTAPHLTEKASVTTVEQQQWNGLCTCFFFALCGFLFGFFSVTEAIHSIDMDERLREISGLDNIKPSSRRGM